MICGNCRKKFSGIRAYLQHKRECQREGWAAHYDAKNRGKTRKADRIARELLGVEREAAPMPEALKAKLRDPVIRKAAQEKARIRRTAIKSMKASLAAAGRRRRRILA
jgi:hypothetical protein